MELMQAGVDRTLSTLAGRGPFQNHTDQHPSGTLSARLEAINARRFQCDYLLYRF